MVEVANLAVGCLHQAGEKSNGIPGFAAHRFLLWQKSDDLVVVAVDDPGRTGEGFNPLGLLATLSYMGNFGAGHRTARMNHKNTGVAAGSGGCMHLLQPAAQRFGLIRHYLRG